MPAWPVLRPRHLVGPRPTPPPGPFPLDGSPLLRFFTARGALYHLFRVLVSQGCDTVLVPAYHHGNEVRALRAAGARIRFYPVDRRMEPDLDALEVLGRDGAGALLVIHYLGWPAPIEAMAAFCRRRGLVLVEDCALALLSARGGRPLGTYGHYAVFCPYKTLPVPNGGLLAGRHGSLQALAGVRLSPCGPLSVTARCAELLLAGLRLRWDRPGRAAQALKRAAGGALDALGIRRVPVGDDGFDLEKASLAMSPLGEKVMARCDHDAIRATRRANFAALRERLAGRVGLVREDLEPGVCPLFFPILVEDKDAAVRELHRQGVEAVPFWNRGDLEAEDLGDVRFLRRHVIELPIHQDIAPDRLQGMAEAVESLRSGFVPRGVGPAYRWEGGPS